MAIEPMGPVVVGVDGSAASMAALDLAAEEAKGRVVPLLVVHASAERGEHAGASNKARLLDVAMSRANADHPSLSVSAAMVAGQPADVLLDQSRNGSVLVVGHRIQCGSRELRDGSVAEHAVSRARLPVIVCRALDTSVNIPTQPRPVLVGVSGRPSDDEVVAFAFAEASLRGAPLWALHIWPGSAGTETRTGALGFAQERDDADRLLVNALMAWAEKYPEVAVHRVVRHGLDVPVALTAASKTAQLIVVGSDMGDDPARQRSWVSGTLLHRAGCGVAVVPTVV